MYQLLFSVGKILNRCADDLLSILPCCLCVKTDEIGIRHLRNGGGGDKLGMEAFGERAQCRENALYIHYNGFTGTGQHHIFLLQEISRHGYASSHSNLVGCTADACNVDPVCSHGFCKCHHLRIIGVFADHLGKTGIMSVYNDVDLILFHDTQISLCIHRFRCAEHDV